MLYLLTLLVKLGNKMFHIKEKNVLITGATSGIGKAAALKLSKLGANIFFIARNEKKAKDLSNEIEGGDGNKPYVIIADLSSQKEIKKAADEFKSLNIPLHVLLNNAGLINMDRKETADGFEEVFALNHLAYYSLTQLLLDNIKNGSPSRIVNVSSGAHAFVKVGPSPNTVICGRIGHGAPICMTYACLSILRHI